jgi:ankyrin repeat protein
MGKMYYRTFSLILILLIASSWTPQLSSASKDELNNDLINAARHGETEQVLALINAGADVNARDEKNKTALDWAKNHNVKVIKLLKSAGAKDNL